VDWDAHYDGKIRIERATFKAQLGLAAVTLAAVVVALVLISRGTGALSKDALLWASSAAFTVLNLKFIADLREARIRIVELDTKKRLVQSILRSDPARIAELELSAVKGIL
jgi:hypothetical protein